MLLVVIGVERKVILFTPLSDSKAAGLLICKSDGPFLKMNLVKFLYYIHEMILLDKVTFQELKEKQKIFNVLSKDLKKKENIEIRMTNMPLYIQFLGCDILEKSEKSYIRAQHCLRKNLTAINPIDDKLIFGVDGGKNLFDVYRNQVMILWNNATDYLWEE